MDINDKPLIGAFKGPSGLNCYALTSEDGSSAEEGGDFPIDLKNGSSILLYLPGRDRGVAVRRPLQQRPFIELGKEDRVFKLDIADQGLCREMDGKLPWLL